MKSTEFRERVARDGAASFWLQRAIAVSSDRDVLDALIDAEALATYCKLRAKEAGLSLSEILRPPVRREYCPRCQLWVTLTPDGEACARCKLVL